MGSLARYRRPMQAVADLARDPAALAAELARVEPLAAARPETIRVVRAPGRVNLIGEHTDYNSGLVLPVAIDLGISLAFVPTDDGRVAITLVANGETAAFDLDAASPPDGTWRDYLGGMAWALAEAGAEVRGFRGLLAADLPIGVGLSSSAALELATAWALGGGAAPISGGLALARAAQRAENEYVGVPCGLMDQAAVALGVDGAALLLDCRSLEHRPVRLPPDLAIVVCDSGQSRRLGASAYAARRADCERALEAIRRVAPDVRSLRDVDEALLSDVGTVLDDVGLRRAPRGPGERSGPRRRGRPRTRRRAIHRSRVDGEPCLAARRFRGEHGGARSTGRPRPGRPRRVRIEAHRRRVRWVHGDARLGRCRARADRPLPHGVPPPRRGPAVRRSPDTRRGRQLRLAGRVTRELPDGPHRRHDPLRDAWVLVSAGRDRRPWQGQVEPPAPAAPPAYDPGCPLCPGNERASGVRNPVYEGPFAFDNDFPPLLPDGEGEPLTTGLHNAEPVSGRARVLCYSPRHDRSLGSLERAERNAAVGAWAGETRELGAAHRWVQVFENRGAAMGASSPHPHAQVWAASSLPTEARREDASQRAHFAATGRALLDDVAAQDRGGPLEVDREGDWLAIVPFWASWPFELLLIAPAPVARLTDLAAPELDRLGDMLGRLVRRFDGLFGRPFPYSMGWHQAPFAQPPNDDAGTAHWRLHAHVYPPLLRADARKFMVGYELLAEPQRDLTPEDAAGRLREVEPRR